MVRKIKTAIWHGHTQALHVDIWLRSWLSCRDSLTQKLIEHSQTFSVQCLYQRIGLPFRDEFAELNLTKKNKVWERDVVLLCNGVPMVYAHTILPLHTHASQWPRFSGLGNRSLGAMLFSDPLVRRGDLHYARLPYQHPLVERLQKVDSIKKLKWGVGEKYVARRSHFYRKQSQLLVTEVFLPSIELLKK